MADIELFNETSLQVPIGTEDLSTAVDAVENGEQVRFGFLEFVYVSEEEIVSINKDHLQRDYVTDIITFSYEDSGDEELKALSGTDIDGTIYMCASRIAEQASEVGSTDKNEFMRIIIHGLLHLCGYDDASDELKSAMTQKENHYLALIG